MAIVDVESHNINFNQGDILELIAGKYYVVNHVRIYNKYDTAYVQETTSHDANSPKKDIIEVRFHILDDSVTSPLVGVPQFDSIAILKMLGREIVSKHIVNTDSDYMVYGVAVNKKFLVNHPHQIMEHVMKHYNTKSMIRALYVDKLNYEDMITMTGCFTMIHLTCDTIDNCTIDMVSKFDMCHIDMRYGDYVYELIKMDLSP